MATNSKRKEVTDWFISMLEKLQKGNKNIKIYEKHFEALSDEAFSELMDKLASGEVTLPFYSANLVDNDVEIANSLKVAKELNIDFFQRIWMIDNVTGVRYLTPEKYLILDLPIRRQSQHVTKGKSVADSQQFVDSYTGQPAGVSRTSRLSLPEILTLQSVGLNDTLEELITVRGGAQQSYRYAKRTTIDTGKYSLKDTHELNDRPTSITTLNSFLEGMHYSSNF